jgi:glutathione-regulated potassium-efflux system ancillary protein KefG
MNQPRRILVLLAHPRYEDSRTIKKMVDSIKHFTEVTVHDLYEEYPEFNIHVPTEKTLLQQHEVIMWLHPIFWYSAPALLKQWIDLVLEHGWAYGDQHFALENKIVLNGVSAGGDFSSYTEDGVHVHSLHEYLRPFKGIARICKMHYLPPFAVYGSRKMTELELNLECNLFRDCVEMLINSEFKGFANTENIHLKDLLQHG